MTEIFKRKALKTEDKIPFYMQEAIGYEDVEKKLSDFDEIDKEMETEHWENIIRRRYEQTNNWLYKVITDTRRADYLNFLPVGKDDIVLDAGAGWGQSTFPLAKLVQQVVALDGSFYKSRFIHKRSLQENVKNITPIVADILDMPFNNDVFNLITMIGVLEYLGEFQQKGDPRKIQLNALKDLRKLLVKDGTLCVAIENSNGYRYIVGEPDDHTGIKHITYKSREEANKISKELRGKPYRTYTYNKDEYEKLFKEAGYSEVRFLYPIPDYRVYQSIVDTKDIELLKFIYKELPFEEHPWYMDEVVKHELELLEKGKISELVNSLSSYFIVAKK